MEIYYDSLQEGTWFKGLHPSLKGATLIAINAITSEMPVAKVLTYDRPDIILADKGAPILVIERTIEVPTGHNVGQRFARLAAAAEAKIPLVYFGPMRTYPLRSARFSFRYPTGAGAGQSSPFHSIAKAEKFERKYHPPS